MQYLRSTVKGTSKAAILRWYKTVLKISCRTVVFLYEHKNGNLLTRTLCVGVCVREGTLC